MYVNVSEKEIVCNSLNCIIIIAIYEGCATEVLERPRRPKRRVNEKEKIISASIDRKALGPFSVRPKKVLWPCSHLPIS